MVVTAIASPAAAATGGFSTAMRWFRVLLLFSSVLLCPASQLMGQAKSTAVRAADLQVGVGFTAAHSTADYVTQTLKGGAVYATLDFTNHLGAEFVIHQVDSGQGDKLYERTYELGARYFRTYGRVKPYVKGMYGRGVYNFVDDSANLAYNMFTGGAGADLVVLPYLNIRADYEYQTWLGFPPTGLHPQLFTFGVAYHFPGGLQRGRHY